MNKSKLDRLTQEERKRETCHGCKNKRLNNQELYNAVLDQLVGHSEDIKREKAFEERYLEQKQTFLDNGEAGEGVVSSNDGDK